MGFIPNDNPTGPIAIPEGMNVNPETPTEGGAGFLGTLAAGVRIGSSVVSEAIDYDIDMRAPLEPELRPFEQIQGTDYEQFADRFIGARTQADVMGLMAQIDRELEDRRTLQVAGWGGIASEMVGTLLSPTTLLPGGAIVRGAKGVNIARTGLSVSAASGVAAALDEAFLQQSQIARTGEESAYSIGGAMILGGALGVGIGSLSARQLAVAGRQTEQVLQDLTDFTEGLRTGDLDRETFINGPRSVGAAEVRGDFRLRRERLFDYAIKTSPGLRTQTSPNVETRRVAAEMITSPYQFTDNVQGQSVLGGNVPVETRITLRQNRDLAGLMGFLGRNYGEYWNDGPVGMVGRFTQPITRQYQHLTGMTEKMTRTQYMQEVGIAMRSTDPHPVPQVQNAVDYIRREIFAPIKQEAVELGLFDETLGLKNTDNYFTRVYNVQKIIRHWGDGTVDDFSVVLRDEFIARREQARRTLVEDDTVFNLERDLMQQREVVSQNQKVLNQARDRAVEKLERAQAAMQREGAVGRATGALRRAFEARRAGLDAQVMGKQERAALQEALKDARGIKRLRPDDILDAIRGAGGIKDRRVGNMWTGRDPDMMREFLTEMGFLEEGSTVDDMLQEIDRAVRGEEVFSRMEDPDVLARYEGAKEFAAAMDEMGVDISQSIDKIIASLPDMSRSQATTRAKAGEAGRSATKAGAREGTAEDAALRALDRLQDAAERLKLIDEEVGPQLRADIKAAQDAIKATIPELKKAQKVRAGEEAFAMADDLEIAESVTRAKDSIVGLKEGAGHYEASMASPLAARALDVADDKLIPWMVNDADVVVAQYFRSMVPDLEMIRTFGSVDLAPQIQRIKDEGNRLLVAAKSQKERTRIDAKIRADIRDIEGMRDRLRNRYGVPKDPNGIIVQAGRSGRAVSFMALLGNMTISAIPDLANILGRGGAMEGASAFINPRRVFESAREMAEVQSAADWYLNNRAMSLSDIASPYSNQTVLDRGLGQASQVFSRATGMSAWNVTMKSILGAVVSSRMMKATLRVRAGKASQRDLLLLSANGIEPWMATRIADQVDRYADKNGAHWIPQGSQWDDFEAVQAMQLAYARELNIGIIEPGAADLPLTFSQEGWKFVLQFKRFGFSAYERVLLAGLQKADADTVMQFTAALALGALVSNINAMRNGKEPKEGAALWEDALDRSGLAGWLMEPYNIVGGMTSGATTISGESVSRYQSRSAIAGLAGPTLDLAGTTAEGLAGITSENGATFRDVQNLLSAQPAGNLPYIMWLNRRIEDAVAAAVGAPPRP
jgi:hypothetical protein